ncbi:acyltransferase family protein [Thermomonospora echinospora]|nr:acyltransferase [Thermomonospora echinospora]
MRGHRPEAVAGAAGGRRLVMIDLLRFVAAFAVVMFHYIGVRPAGIWPVSPRELFPEMTWTWFGAFGVDLFFVISGFVILMSAWGRTPGAFAISRVTRLFPAYWFGVVLCVVVYALTGLEHGYGPKMDGVYERFLPNLTMLQTGVGSPNMEGLYWTLWVELHFYALVTVLAWWGITYSRCVGFMTVWLLAGLFAKEADVTLLETLLIPRWAPYFIGGMALYLVYRYGGNIILWLFVGACWALALRYSLPTSPREPRYWPGVHEYVCVGVVTGIFVVMALVATGHFGWVRWRGLTVLGALTYPLYLVHLTVFRPVVDVLYPEAGRWPTLVVAVAVALASAYLVYRFVEKPGGRLLSRHLKAAAARIREASAPAAPRSEVAAVSGEPDGSRGAASGEPAVAAT